MREFIELGKKIYDMDNPREVRRMVVFVGRAMLHRKGMQRLLVFFEKNDLLKSVMKDNPYYFEQLTRSFFYNGSSFGERLQLIENHLKYIQEFFVSEWAMKLASYHDNTYEIWKSEYEGQLWNAMLGFEPGQRKEGLLAVNMNLGHGHLYQIVFWCGQDKEGKSALWIGAMQGPNMADAKDIVKKITKKSFSYRTKNLILYMTQAVARTMGIERIYAVTNYGYYANNHIRSDRKLKTNFEDFWLEAGGKPTEDKRFYELPLTEPRKTMEEVPTRKRAVYRKRFEFLDAVDAEIEVNVRKIRK